LTARTWAMDPALYYLADFNFHRIARGDEVLALPATMEFDRSFNRIPPSNKVQRLLDFSGKVVYVHLVGNPSSTKVLSELSGLAASVKLSWTLDGFEIYEVQLKL
jgi:hypothetical protein